MRNMPLRDEKLQLGHAGEGVEICLNSSPVCQLVALQLGHAGEGVEIGVPMVQDGIVFTASIGPRR